MHKVYRLVNEYMLSLKFHPIYVYYIYNIYVCMYLKLCICSIPECPTSQNLTLPVPSISNKECMPEGVR